MTRLRVMPGARADLDEAAAYLDGNRRGAAAKFRVAVRAAFTLIRNNPRAGAVCGGGGHRRRPIGGGFQYLVVWDIRGDEVRVVAVWHGSREPDSWMDRTDE